MNLQEKLEKRIFTHLGSELINDKKLRYIFFLVKFISISYKLHNQKHIPLHSFLKSANRLN